jgi:hypothetical protein
LHKCLTAPSWFIVTTQMFATICGKHQWNSWSAGMAWDARKPHWMGLTQGVPWIWASPADLSCSSPWTLVFHVCVASAFCALAVHFKSSFYFWEWRYMAEGLRRGAAFSLSLRDAFSGTERAPVVVVSVLEVCQGQKLGSASRRRELALRPVQVCVLASYASYCPSNLLVTCWTWSWDLQHT